MSQFFPSGGNYEIYIIGATVMLFGCAQTPPPTSMNTTDWQSFGEEMALKGKNQTD
ncbi:hypothetical protein O9929_06690 [Vibrio lentus]|nr:hypothetical protein [Vibrio lentus]